MSKRSSRLTYTEQMQRLASKYLEANGDAPATAAQIADWAIRNKFWQAPHASIVKLCAEDLARAMREEYFKDPQGRRVRAKHVARIEKDGEQFHFWADMRTATREHMEVAFKQRRQQIVSDCRQLKVDVDSYNENKNPGEPIQIPFDFTPDLEELELASVS